MSYTSLRDTHPSLQLSPDFIKNTVGFKEHTIIIIDYFWNFTLLGSKSKYLSGLLSLFAQVNLMSDDLYF